MPKIKFPELREITSLYPEVVKNLSKCSLLDYQNKKSSKPPIFLIDDDGVISACDKNGNTSETLFDKTFDYCKTLSERHQFAGFNEYDIFNDFRRIERNVSKKQYRVKKIIERLLWSDCNFLMLSFKPSVYDNTTETTRRRYIRDYLNSLGCLYLANVDYGDKGGREHYHAIVQRTDIEYKDYRSKYGRINGQKIVYKDYDALKRYICKLTNHSIKASTKNKRILTNVDLTSCNKLF